MHEFFPNSQRFQLQRPQRNFGILPLSSHRISPPRSGQPPFRSSQLRFGFVGCGAQNCHLLQVVLRVLTDDGRLPSQQWPAPLLHSSIDLCGVEHASPDKWHADALSNGVPSRPKSPSDAVDSPDSSVISIISSCQCQYISSDPAFCASANSATSPLSAAAGIQLFDSIHPHPTINNFNCGASPLRTRAHRKPTRRTPSPSIRWHIAFTVSAAAGIAAKRASETS